MTDRDRLIELFKGAESKVMEELNKHSELDEEEWMGIYADHLIANGVILSPVDIGKTVYKVSLTGKIVSLNVANYDCDVITSPYDLISFNSFGKPSSSPPKKPKRRWKGVRVMPDNVNHPAHYESGQFECIDVMLETQGAEATQKFCICNAFKYLYRHRRKNGAEDIAKAKWYLDKYLEIKKEQENE